MSTDEELEPKLDALLGALRGKSDFPEERRAAMFERLATTIDASSRVEAPLRAGAPARFSSGALSSKVRRGVWIVASGAIGIVIGRASVSSPSSTSAPPSRRDVVSETSLAASAPQPSAAAIDVHTLPVAAPSQPRPTAAASSRTAATADHGDRTVASETGAEPTPPAVERSSESSSLREERALIEQGRAAIARRDGLSALEALTLHARHFPDGKLAEERDALVIQATVLQGRLDDAQRKARLFADRYPNSVFLSRVERLTAPR